MNPAIEDDAALRRHVRTIITMADNVRRGALPPRALKRIVSHDVATDIVSELPSTPGVSTVSAVHLQRESGTRAFFTGSALRPDGSAVAYLGMARREAPTDSWQVTQVLPVSEKAIGREADGAIGAAPPDQVAAFRTVISNGFLDAAVELLGQIPEAAGQRRTGPRRPRPSWSMHSGQVWTPEASQESWTLTGPRQARRNGTRARTWRPTGPPMASTVAGTPRSRPDSTHSEDARTGTKRASTWRSNDESSPQSPDSALQAGMWRGRFSASLHRGRAVRSARGEAE